MKDLKEKWGYICSQKRVIAPTVLLLLFLLVLHPFIAPHVSRLYDPTEIRAFVKGFGPLASIVFIFLMALQVVIAPIPGGVFMVAGGLLFGTLWGTMVLLIGLSIGTIGAVYVSRRWGRPAVTLLVPEHTMEKFDSFTERHGMITYALLMLLPGFPDDPIILIAGLTTLSFWKIIIYGIFLRLPAMVVLAFSGDSLIRYGLKMFLLITLILNIIGAIAVWKREQIIDYVKSRIKGSN